METPNKKISNAVTLILIVVMAIIAFGIKKCKDHRQLYPERTITATIGDWRHHKIVYTSHARCRMNCRDITEEEVEYILDNGTLNEAKSQEENDEVEGHCQPYALEGNTKDGQHVRIVFAPKDDGLVVVTVIDLDTEWKCDCK